MTYPTSVAVIIPCFNQANFLAAAIESVLAQEHEYLEVVVVNDGSTDQTSEVAKQFSHPVRLVEQKNGGLPNARNRGLAEASSEFVLFLDADDLLAPKAINAFVAAAAGNPSGNIFYGGWQFIDQSGKPLKQLPPPKRPTDPFHWLLRRNRFPCHAVFARRNLLWELSGFFEPLKAHEDWDLWLRVAANNHQFFPVPDALAVYRRYPGSMSQNLQRMQSTGLEVLGRNSKTHMNCQSCRNIIAEASFDFQILPFFTPLADQDINPAWLAKGLYNCVRHQPVLAPQLAYYSLVYGLRFARGREIRN